MATSIEAVVEFKRLLFFNYNGTLDFSPVTKSTLLENGGYNKGCDIFQVEYLEIRLE